MSSSNSAPSSGLAPGPAPSNASPNSDRNQSKYEASVLARKADAEGWSEEKLTMALSDAAAKSQPSADTTTPAPAPAESEGQSEGKSKGTIPVLSETGQPIVFLYTSTPPEGTESEREAILAKRQETVRAIHQAEMEGWSDEKLVAALRNRLGIRVELLASPKILKDSREPSN